MAAQSADSILPLLPLPPPPPPPPLLVFVAGSTKVTSVGGTTRRRRFVLHRQKKSQEMPHRHFTLSRPSSRILQGSLKDLSGSSLGSLSLTKDFWDLPRRWLRSRNTVSDSRGSIKIPQGFFQDRSGSLSGSSNPTEDFLGSLTMSIEILKHRQ